MRNTRNPQNLQSSQRKQNSNFQHELSSTNTNKNHQKTRPAFNFFKAAAKKVAGVFTIFPRKKGKAVSKGATPDNSINHSGQVRGISFSADLSTASTSRSSSKFKYSDSYSSSNTANGQVGVVNFSIEEIKKATENFSPANRIGEGGFGTVYKGRLNNASLVAIKRARKNTLDKRLSTEFKNEILTLSQIEHLNLVRLFGYLEQRDERIIVLEYVGNGTLREHLDGTRGNNGLEISERLDIAIDVAHAITYLHMYTDPPIIHRDIKASNILITEKLRAKVADFGLARLASEDPGATHISTQVKGTAGYLDPEYLRTYQLTEKSDVYSFGVLLVELVTGRHPIEPKRPLKERVTTQWAMHRLKDGDAVIVMDLKLRRSPASIIAVEKVLKLARQCIAPSRQSRPTMKRCAEVLWGIRKDFREKASSSSSSSSAAAPSHLSDNILEKNARKGLHNSLGVEDDNGYKFISA